VLRSRGVTIIPLGPASLPGSCDLPEGSNAPSRCVSAEADSLPIWSCSVWGLPCPGHCCPGGALLPHLFTLTFPASREAVYFLWHWPSSSFEAGIPDVIRHTALRSSDFPPRRTRATVRSTCLYLIIDSRGRDFGSKTEGSPACRRALLLTGKLETPTKSAENLPKTRAVLCGCCTGAIHNVFINLHCIQLSKPLRLWAVRQALCSFIQE